MPEALLVCISSSAALAGFTTCLCKMPDSMSNLKAAVLSITSGVTVSFAVSYFFIYLSSTL
jgi:hypothetical protein